jgi:hypothetical protein
LYYTAPVGRPSDTASSNRKILRIDSMKTSKTSSPIFVGGAGRSGTKLVRAILNAHPNLITSHELKVTPQIAEAWHGVRSYARHLNSHFDTSPEEIDALFADTIDFFLRKVAARQGGKRVVEKTPNNAYIFGHLSYIFPSSPLIHIIRDGRDVVRSLLEKTWARPDGTLHPVSQDPKTAATYWREIVESGRNAAQADRVRKNYLEIRYEDLVNHPTPVMRRIITHVHEEWDKRIPRFYEFEDPLYPGVQRTISNASVGKWKHALSPSTKSTIKDVAGDLLIELGYARDKNW